MKELRGGRNWCRKGTESKMVLTDHAQSVILYPSACAHHSYHTDEVRRLFPYVSSVDSVKEGPFVVGVAGRDLETSARLLNSMVGADAFQTRAPDGRMADFSTNEQYQCMSEQSVVQMYHDKPSNILYLCLSGSIDVAVINQTLEAASNAGVNADLHRWLVDQEDDHCKALLYLFLVSHVILVTSPVDKFNLHYLKLFRALQSTRAHMSSSLHSYLAVSTGLPTLNTTYCPGRTVPVLAFVFPRTPELCAKIDQRSTDGKSSSTTKWRKLQQSLETQTRMLLRRFYCPPGGGTPVLFTFDTSRCILFASPSSATAADYWSDPMELMSSVGNNSTNGKSGTSGAGQASSSALGGVEKDDSMATLVRFIDKQRENCRANRRHQLLPMSSWLLVAAHIRDYICNAKESGGSDPTYKLQEYIDVTAKFSSNQCQHALPVAKDAYQEDLPSHYSLTVHEAQLARAQTVFRSVARGPEVEVFLAKLAEECLRIWEDGRQLCDALSVTGRQCVFEVHETPSGRKPGSRSSFTSKPLECKEHSSDVVSVHACNCGRSRGDRSDPFSVPAANRYFDFAGCCDKLKRSLFADGVAGDDDGEEEPPSWTLHVLGSASTYSQEFGIDQDGFIPRHNFLSRVLLGSASDAATEEQLLGSTFDFVGGGGGSDRSRDRVVVNVGVEYECPEGHRFLSTQIKPSITEPMEQYGSALPIYCQCLHEECQNSDVQVAGKPSSHMAQLQRIFVTNESTEQTVLLSPVVEYGPQEETQPQPSSKPDAGADGSNVKSAATPSHLSAVRDSFSPGTYVRIPENSFCVLRLPYVYQTHEGNIRTVHRVGSVLHSFTLQASWLQASLNI